MRALLKSKWTKAAVFLDIQAFFVGPSFGLFSIDPMRIYEQTGIVSYNISSASQPLEISYYMVKDALRTQSPRYVFLDIGHVFSYWFENPFYRYVLDSMPLNSSKDEFARAYAAHFPEEKRLAGYLSAYFPIYQYHDRWSELRSMDLALIRQERSTFTKGYYPCPSSIDSGMYVDSVADINASAVGYTSTIENGAADSTLDEERVYQPQIMETEWDVVLRIKALCEEHGAELRLMKIPACVAPQDADSAWTRIKSDMIRAAAAESGIPYIDMMYDVDIGIDWTQDSVDGGTHLNWLGAKKVSDFLAGYLQSECGLAGVRDENYERDVPAYDKMSRVADLMMTDSLAPYLERAAALGDVTVFLSAADDMRSALHPEDMAALNAFGLQTDFNALQYSDAYLAVKEGDAVVYEASSNREISKAGALGCGSDYSVTSCGWLVGSQSEIVIDGTNYSIDWRGINIVVFDNESHLVLDSVAFDTWNEEDQSAIRDYSYNFDKCLIGCSVQEAYLLDYKQFLISTT